MKQPPATTTQDDAGESRSTRLFSQIFDPNWYQARYSDVATSNLDPFQHFIRHGAAERRDPNRFFDSAWYVEQYPDVAASGLSPLLHYMQAGATELRNPHPRFDAAYYVDQHPDAASNPLFYHLRLGLARGYLTEKPIDIRDYLPSEIPSLPPPGRVFADVVIPAPLGVDETRRCIRSVLADRAFPLARIIVVDDRSPEPELVAWLKELAAEGQIHLIRTRRRLGFAASANLGIDAAETHDVVLLSSDSQMPAGWLGRLSAHAYSQRNIATVSPFSNNAWICGYPDDEGGAIAFGETPARMDEVCRTVNASRSADTPLTIGHCMYIRRDALHAVGVFSAERFMAEHAAEIDFCLRATAAGWRHRLACDTFVYRSRSERPRGLPQSAQPDFERSLAQHAALGCATPFRFTVTAALLRQSKLPVILMISHNLDGGVRKHIDGLSERYKDTARILLLAATNRGAALSIRSLPNHPVLTLPSDRLDDLVTVLRSMNVSRIHIHHLVQMHMDIRALIHRLGVPFDVTVHDYYAICPQINLLMWSEGFYCGEPGPAGCNACIADRSSHGASDIVSWRRDRAWQFIDADRVICPSADVKARLDRHGLGARAIMVLHEQQTQAHWISRLPEFSSPPLRIALIGVLANHKGARAVAEVAEATTRKTIELHLIGHLEDNFPKAAVKLIKVTGKYQDRDLPALLKRIDPHVLWFPSPWPETYSYTLSSAIETGLPIVAADIGAFTERLSGRPLSWLVDHRASAQDWLAAFDAVRTTLRDRMIQPPVPRPRTISDFYADRYLSPAASSLSVTYARKPRIAIVPERYDTGGLTPCAYIRLLQPLDHPAIGGSFDIMLMDTETVFHSDADIIVTQRYAIPDIAMANRLADHAHRTGAKLLFDLDDDLLNVPTSHPESEKLRPLAQIVRRMLTVADVVWVSTVELAKSLATIRPDAVVMENRLDERIWIRGPAPRPFRDDPVRILCMGTTTHARDFAMIEPALVRLKGEYGDRIVIDVLGMTSQSDLPAELNRIGPTIHATRSYPGFVDWLTSMQPRWHIGLAPLLDTPFNRGKSPIKAMEYAALGLVVLASDTPVYRGSIADGPAGQLVASDRSVWHAALDWLIRDQDLRQASAIKAYQAFLTQATLANQADRRRAALAQLLPNRAFG
jgi:GT2 family glycosyltransferase/glycosyltransferase involved in cell wall biosynthesis